MTMKLLIIGLLILFPFLFTIGEWLLSWTWTGDGDALQIILYVHDLPVNVPFDGQSDSTMGLFPITMNILQFWLIDSIVKASTPAWVALEGSPNISHHPDREALFRTSSDDGDDGEDYRRRDVENQYSIPPSLSRDASRHLHDKSFTGSSTPDEHKSTGGTSDQTIDPHSYPPNLSSNIASTSSSSNKSHGSPRPAHNLLKNAKRRPAPAPLSIRNAHTPAVNSPGVPGSYHAVPNATIPKIVHVPELSKESEAWAETWEESEDWEHRNRAGDEVDHRNLGNVWGSIPIIQVSS